MTSAPTADTDWSLRGLPAVVLDNGLTQVVVLPTLGGKIWQLRDLRSSRQFLWHHPAVPPAPVPFGGDYDNNFHGGWDELFPNDIPEQLGDETYPDHGELWSRPWDHEVRHSAERAEVTLTLTTPISGCRVSRTVAVEAGRPGLVIDQRIENLTHADLPFLWKHHVALPVDEPARIDLPPSRVQLGDFGRPRAGRAGQVYEWPHLPGADGSTHDMRTTPPGDSGIAEFQYATGLAAGWCALTYSDGTGLALAFDPAVFGDCWTFASYGGWRNLRVAVLEPCTGHPVSVRDGLAAGTHRVLRAGTAIETRLRAVTYTGLASVSHADLDGTVVGEVLQ